MRKPVDGGEETVDGGRRCFVMSAFPLPVLLKPLEEELWVSKCKGTFPKDLSLLGAGLCLSAQGQSQVPGSHPVQEVMAGVWGRPSEKRWEG